MTRWVTSQRYCLWLDRSVSSYPAAATIGLEHVLAPPMLGGDLDQAGLLGAVGSHRGHLTIGWYVDGEPPLRVFVRPRWIAALAPRDQLVGASPRLA